MLDNRIFITGGTGFLGRHLVQRFLGLGVSQVTVYSRDEKKHYDLRNAFPNAGDRLHSVIGDVRDAERLKEAAMGHDLFIHAAAMKHITHCEQDPGEAYRTNVVGAENAIRAIRASGAYAVFISTDKAVSPSNVYGATKMIQEGLFRASGIPCDGVRYGNVLSSTGSVVPFFRREAQAGRCLPVTDAAMTRFFLPVAMAVGLVLYAIKKGSADGTIYVPRAKSARIGDVAQVFATTYGTSWRVVGTRPGEKMHESLLSERDAGLCEDQGDVVAIRAPAGGFDAIDRSGSLVNVADFTSSGPVMSEDEVRAFLETEGEL